MFIFWSLYGIELILFILSFINLDLQLCLLSFAEMVEKAYPIFVIPSHFAFMAYWTENEVKFEKEHIWQFII